MDKTLIYNLLSQNLNISGPDCFKGGMDSAMHWINLYAENTIGFVNAYRIHCLKTEMLLVFWQEQYQYAR